MKIKYVFAALFLFIIATPFLLNIAVNGAKEGLILETENRQAADFKPLENFRISKIKIFFDDFDKFLQDRLISKDFIVKSFIDFTARNNFRLFLADPLFIEGKDNFVFITKLEFVLERHIKGYSSKHAKELTKNFNELLNKLKYISDISNKNKIDFFVFVGPDKHSVYCKKLPNYLGKNVCSISKEVTNNQIKKLNSLGIKTIYPVDELRKLAEHQNLYYKTDTHWNILGAEQAFYILMNKISESKNKYRDMNFIPNKDYYLIPYKNVNVGDLKKQGLSQIYSFSETAYKFRSKYNKKILWKKDNQKNYKKKFLDDVVSEAFQKIESMVNIMANNKTRILLIHDSLTENLSYFFNLNFKEVMYLSYYTNNIVEIKNTIEEFKPELIIYETVERHF